MKPHIYMVRGEWTCALPSGRWHVWPYGKGRTAQESYKDWIFKRVLDNSIQNLSYQRAHSVYITESH